MKNLTDRNYLLQRQYSDASNLQARIALHQCYSTNPQGLPHWFIEHLQVPGSGRVLEVGCGPGGYWPEISESIPASWQITVSDFSPGMLAQARQRLSALDRPFSVVPADVQSLPFPDGSFDAVIANFMLYHVPDRPRALAEIHRVLAVGGHLFAMTNGNRHMREFKELVDRVVPGTIRDEELGFSLQNGPAQLAPWFDDIRTERYPDALIVTKVEPLLAYIRSYAVEITEDQEEALRKEVQREIDRSGVFKITKDPGMITGVRH